MQIKIWLYTFCLLLACGVNAETPEKAEKPNVIVILIDDLSHYGVTAYGAKKLRSLRGEFEDTYFSTPNIDNIAKAGLKVDHAFAYPLCENTRVALMSGKGNHRNYLKPKALHHSDITFGDAFQRAGYKTGLFGKWKQSRGTPELKGLHYISQFGWDEYTAFDVVAEGARMINPNMVINGKPINYAGRTDMDPQTGRRWFGPDIVNRDALAFIDKHKEAPFFLYYPMMLVHDEHTPTPDTMPREAFDNFPEYKHGKRDGDDRQYFPDMIEYADKLIGNVVRKLQETGLTENTLIIVVGDNGTKETFAHITDEGEVWPARKGGNTDNGLRVPLVLSMPGTIEHNTDGTYRTYQGMVDITDIFPTIAEAASIPIPRAELLDGISFWPQAIGAKGEARDHIYRWYNANYEYIDYEEKGLSFVFTKNFKRYFPNKEYPQGRFFDLRSDPLEKAGATYAKGRFGVRRYSGLDIENLSGEQNKAYAALGALMETHQYVPTQSIQILDAPKTIQVGQVQQLNYRYAPINAQRTGSVWHSSDPAVAEVNKFGEVIAHQAGKVTISLYSWEDAFPLSSQRKPAFFQTGISHDVQIEVKP